ncbi:hypothetical protein [Pedobacter gandavensis]|uniref:Uncharacterized protein n=1 Tax=Pedobacter gandavensis TaxID=2679963 RepID=A0ABR6F3W4_9SPHI|nr:hypothetical protein [Pedobacter gandavensis]MBB2151709.1 hypothetical protein [Pedobacter gandavensis]
MTKKNAVKPLKTTKEMTVIAPTEEILLAQNLELRNEAVEQAYKNIIKGCKELLTAFDTLRYRMHVTIDHTNSGKETNLINEFISYFWDITLTRNRFNYYMIYVSYDEEALTRFGHKIFNRMLRIVFNNTNITATDINIENSVRIDHSATDIQIFFLNRLLSDPKDYIIVTAEEKVPS